MPMRHFFFSVRTYYFFNKWTSRPETLQLFVIIKSTTASIRVQAISSCGTEGDLCYEGDPSLAMLYWIKCSTVAATRDSRRPIMESVYCLMDLLFTCVNKLSFLVNGLPLKPCWKCLTMIVPGTCQSDFIWLIQCVEVFCLFCRYNIAVKLAATWVGTTITASNVAFWPTWNLHVI